MDHEYTLRIDAFTPDTLPMARLAEYLAQFAELLGHKPNTHFSRLEKGSAMLVSRVDETEAPKVLQRIVAARGDAPPQGIAKAMRAIDDLLAADNATGELLGPKGAVLIPFPGRLRPRPLTFPAFRQDGSIDGQIVNVGGRDKTAHVILQDGPISYSNIDLNRELAREMAKHLYGPKIRLFGSGRWERSPEGAWKLLSFTVDRYEVLDEAPLSQVLDQIRSAPGNGLMGDPEIYSELMSLRLGEDDVH